MSRHNTNLRLTKEDHLLIKRLAEQEDTPIAIFCRKIILDFLKKEANPQHELNNS